jgi:glucokinase
MPQPWRIGIDLGGTKIALGLIDPASRIVARERIPTWVEQGPAQAITRTADAVRTLMRQAPSDSHVARIGICSPGPIDRERGLLLDPPNLTDWRDVPVRDLLRAQTGLPVNFEHDAKAAALGEFVYGAGRGARDMVYVIVGTGMGGALIIDGALHRGHANAAGELGHITINRDGEPCSCGRFGCAEAYAAGPAIERRYRAHGGVVRDADSARVVDLSLQGDPAARQAMTDAGAALGAAIASVAMIVDIELFVIGGGVARAGNALLQPARDALKHHAFASVAPRIRIAQCEHFEDGAILGAAEGDLSNAS